MNKRITIVAIASSFLIGGGISAVANAAPVVPAAKVVTKTVNVPGPERVVTKIEKVDVPGPVTNKTPQSCLDALDKADKVISIAGDGFEIAGRAIVAAAGSDLAGMTSANEDLSVSADEMSTAGPAYRSAREECKSDDI